MNRLGEAAFVLLLFTPLADARGFGTDALRLPIMLALIAVLMARVAWSLARRREDSSRSDPLRTAAFVFAGACLLSLLPAIERWDSVGPILTLFCGIASYIFLTSGCLARSFLFRWALPAVGVCGLLFAACGLGQHLFAHRAATATVGNPNYAGAFSGMLVPFAAAMVFMKRSAAWRAGMAVVAVALMAHVYVSGSRGGMLGAVAGLLIVSAALARRMKRVWIISAAVAGLVVIALAGKGSDAFTRSDTVRVRLGVWRGAVRMTLASPVRWFLGVGIGNFAAQFPPYREPEEFAIAERGAGAHWVEAEDAHSTWIHLAAETGIIGLFGWLLVLYVGMRLWRYYLKTAPDEDYTAVLAGAGGGIAAFLISGFFNSLHLFAAPSLFFWICLGLIEQLGNQRVRVQHKPLSDLRVGFHAAAFIVGLFGSYLMAAVAADDLAYHRSLRTDDPRERIAYLDSALAHNYRDWRAQFALGATYMQMESYADASPRFREVLARHPNHVGALNRLAQARFAGEGALDEALALLNRAIGIAPYYFQSYYNRGWILLRSKNVSMARDSFVQARDRKPGHGPSTYGIADTYYREGAHDLALEEYRRARTLGVDVAKGLRQDHPEAESDALYREFFK